MFSGRYDHALDDKGRTMVPKDFRTYLAQLGERTLYVTFALGQPRRLEVRPASSFDAYQRKVTGMPKSSLLERFTIFYFGSAERVEVDKTGRLLISANLRKLVNLEDKVVFVGIDGERFQIWRPEDMDELHDFCDTNADAIQDALGNVLCGGDGSGL